ncbi:unnamed protein product [Musa banksii]
MKKTWLLTCLCSLICSLEQFVGDTGKSQTCGQEHFYHHIHTMNIS